MKVQRQVLFLSFLLLLCASVIHAQPSFPFRDEHRSIDSRVADLISRLTLEEKISLLGYNSKAVPRLGIPAYNWWNEGLHGVARAGLSTVFPQAIGMAATFNDSLLQEVASVISTEARAKYNLAIQLGRREQYMGLSFWSPNINIFRDPRWGRGQETYGEDPFLTATMGVAFVKGMQGNDEHYLKAAAGAKHFAVHSGPEAGRHSFNAIVDEKDLRETYLYAFKKLVDAGVESVMCAYNRVNGQPCCTGDALIKNILRREWGFKGHVVTDCWALDDIWQQHKAIPNRIAVAAAALKAGVNLDCSDLLQNELMEAIRQKLVTVREVDDALTALLRTQFKLGFYDRMSSVPFRKLGAADVHAPAHVALARRAAQQSMVLLKNTNELLPLDKKNYKSIMVLGPNAGSIEPLLGNYHGVSSGMVSFVEGITEAAGPATAVQYDQGSDYSDTLHFGGIWAAGNSDITIAVLGLTPVMEGEEGDAFLAANGGDKLSLDIPPAHLALLKALRKKGKPVVVVLNGGGAINIKAIEPYADAIILAWYPGEQGGRALADILFGLVSPGGRLPVSFYQSLSDLPPYDDYAMKGRTYRYFQGPVQYPFGFGLSYTTFSYRWLQPPVITGKANNTIEFSIALKNSGKRDGDEVVQVYIEYPKTDGMPLKELKSFRRLYMVKGTERKVSFQIPINELKKWDSGIHDWKIYPGEYKIRVGGDARDSQLISAFTLPQPADGRNK